MYFIESNNYDIFFTIQNYTCTICILYLYLAFSLFVTPVTPTVVLLRAEFDSEPEASEFDLGNKIRTPRDIMLEELSLMNNKGSKMFRMRQKRVEKFIWENNPDVFSESMVRAVGRSIHRWLPWALVHYLLIMNCVHTHTLVQAGIRKYRLFTACQVGTAT